MNTEAELAAVCTDLQHGVGPTSVTEAIARGEDPLGEWFCRLRSMRARRERGATYTPKPLIERMMSWAKTTCRPARILDPGCGSGRFLVAAARAFPDAELVGIDCDPLAAEMTRAHLSGAGVSARARVVVADYTQMSLPAIAGTTLFVGNPPYVRHHRLGEPAKEWLRATARRHGLAASALAGLHAYFFLATLEHARPGDAGCFITAAEWLDTRYGELVRALLRGPLGLVHLDPLPAAALPFKAMTTAAISGFVVGDTRPTVTVGAREVARTELMLTRWSELARAPRPRSSSQKPLGELCRVHRGQVTGKNRVWIAGKDTPPLPVRFLVPAVTRARELFAAAPTLSTAEGLEQVIDLPANLDALPEEERAAVETFLAWARERGADQAYVARHRNPWWSVKLAPPAPILATYMARRKPVFVRNLAGARHINIAHGIYPTSPLSPADLDALATELNETVDLSAGRTYAGGLVKFEPREMERLLISSRDRDSSSTGC